MNNVENYERLRAVIVEDEEKDLQVIVKILTDYYSNFVEVVGVCQSVANAVDTISKVTPDLVFMDIVIQGNRYGAFDILGKVQLNFQIIFITGNSDVEYYAKAIKLHCLDYIVKPSSIDDFNDPLTRAWNNKQILKEQMQRAEYAHQLELFIRSYKNKQENEAIPLPIEFGHAIVKASDIVKCISEGNYTEVYLSNSTRRLVSGNLKHIEALLSKYDIVRVHRQCLVNMAHICTYSKRDGGVLHLSDGERIYIGESWRKTFEEAYCKYFNLPL